MNSVYTDVFSRFHHGWALLTAGNASHYNTMTISWGSVGCLWNRPVVTVYVRPSRYTDHFLQTGDFFTVSFYDESHRKALGLLGTLSGRDTDKIATAGFTPVKAGESVTFEQAETTLVCKKLFCQDMKAEQIPEEIREKFYLEGEAPHRIYIGEILTEIHRDKELK